MLTIRKSARRKVGKRLLDCKLFYLCIFVLFRRRRHFRRAFSGLLSVRTKYEADAAHDTVLSNALPTLQVIFMFKLTVFLVKTLQKQSSYNSVFSIQIFAATKLSCSLRIGKIISLLGKANIVD